MNATFLQRALFTCISVLLSCAVPSAIHAAELVFNPGTGSFPAGDDFSIKVGVNPAAGESVNAADGVVTFDKDLISVVSISKDGSSFSLWTADPSFSNSAGTVTFSGGTPTAFTTPGTVVTIKFKAKAPGTVKLAFSKGSVLAADGKGTDVYKAGEGASYTITEAAPAPEPEEDTSGDLSEGTPIAPTITSSTHPKADTWYATSTVEYAWKNTPDVTNVRTLFSEKEDAAPKDVSTNAVTSRKLSDVADGTWFAVVQFKNDLGWGEVSRRKFLIDTVPPEAFEFTLKEGEIPKFAFQAEDLLSGVDRYEIVIAGTTMGTFPVKDLVDGAYPVPPQEGGLVKVAIKAYDKAGNVRESAKEVTLPVVVKTVKGKPGEEVEKPPIFTIERLIIVLFAMIIGGVVAWNMYTRKQEQQDRSRILHQVMQVRDKNDKIFSALREEFEEMINDLDERPQLTPSEREFMEKVQEALDISEELVDSSMEELKKTIRG